MPKMTGGQALARSLAREGVRVIFGLPGVQLYHATDALYDEPGIRFINVRHEQATAYMADGYARASGRPGTAMVVPGPGLMNASAAIGTAYAASSPVLVIAGQVNRDLIGVDRGILHEVNDQQDIIRPVTKAAYRVLDPTEIPAVVREAFRQLRTGRPRPVEIEIPPETLAEEADIELLEPGDDTREAADQASIEEAARILAAAERPLIWAGGGVISSGASDALLRVAEHLQAPVVATPEGKGAIPDSHYLSLGAMKRDDPMRDHLATHDVILAVGTRFAVANPTEAQRVVQIEIDPDEAGRNFANTHRVVGDARATLEALHEVLTSTSEPRPSRRAELEAYRAGRAGPELRVEPQDALLKAVRSAVPDDGILVAGMTQLGYYSRAFYPVYEPGTYMTSSYFGNLGYAYPVALGAKVAQPGRAVVALSGDGGFQFNVQELATAVQHNINAVVVVFNDNAYGNVLRDQMVRFNGRVIGAELHNPDFVRLAEAYGVRGVRADGPDALELALREALAIEAPTLIEVPVGPMPSPF
ncbi:MAG: thiamine pyrophosphate-binding protein [Chloroflexi bacterium]|nr:thiamine pyrophosphate-binding protein [Chloroflexota bacterium]